MTTTARRDAASLNTAHQFRDGQIETLREDVEGVQARFFCSVLQSMKEGRRDP